MALISAYAMKNPDFRDVVKRKTYPMTYRNGIYPVSYTHLAQEVVKIHQEYPDMGYRRMNDWIKKYSESHLMVSDSPVSYTHLMETPPLRYSFTAWIFI